MPLVSHPAGFGVASRVVAIVATILAVSARSQETPQVEAREIEPRKVDYGRIAFYPKRWQEAEIDFEMLAFEGESIVFVVKPGDYDVKQLSRFVGRLDQGWAVYRDLIGATPRPFRQVDGKPTICALPKPGLSCGYGCGYVGASGIEVSAFYSVDLPAFKRNADSFQHYYFYEMGRNYFVFGDRHSVFTTGFAVFMRYVCMDRLQCHDTDERTREVIEHCEELYAQSNIGFFDAFTNFGAGEKSNRLRDEDGRIIFPSDQPVMYATAMLKLRKDYGGDDWVRKFFHYLRQANAHRATDVESARTQAYNWLVCASAAARRDLTSVFADRWRMPLATKQREILDGVDWSNESLSVSAVVEKLLRAGGERDR